MNLDFLRPLFDRPGPWVSVYLDATRASENADHEVSLRWRALREQLEQQGADAGTLDAVQRAVDEHPYQPGRYGLAVFARAGEASLVETLSRAARAAGRSARRGLVVAAALALALAASAHAAAPAPGARWQHVAPAAAGFDGAKLARIAALARKGHSNCLVVVRRGKLVGEWYFNGTGPNTAQDVYSATKSFASTLVGIAQDDGDLRISDRASKWIAAWRGTPSQGVTVRDLLSMDSGRSGTS